MPWGSFVPVAAHKQPLWIGASVVERGERIGTMSPRGARLTQFLTQQPSHTGYIQLNRPKQNPACGQADFVTTLDSEKGSPIFCGAPEAFCFLTVIGCAQI
jgi:hypothetical protein